MDDYTLRLILDNNSDIADAIEREGRKLLEDARDRFDDEVEAQQAAGAALGEYIADAIQAHVETFRDYGEENIEPVLFPDSSINAENLTHSFRHEQKSILEALLQGAVKNMKWRRVGRHYIGKILSE